MGSSWPRKRQCNVKASAGLRGADAQRTAEGSDPAPECGRTDSLGIKRGCIITATKRKAATVISYLHNQLLSLWGHGYLHHRGAAMTNGIGYPFLYYIDKNRGNGRGNATRILP
jgi:hypothetical protein